MLVGQTVAQAADGPSGPGGQPEGDDPYSQRQEPTCLGQSQGIFPLSGHPLLTDTRLSSSMDSEGWKPSRSDRNVVGNLGHLDSRCGEVTTTTQLAESGSRARTWASSFASSSTMSNRRLSTADRNSAPQAARSSGRFSGAIPKAVRKPASTVPGSAGTVSLPRRAAKSCPYGKKARARCATWRASVVFPHPAHADDADQRESLAVGGGQG
ncbi:hypothetical protein ADK38_02780 [Streptomyces varsoviensis]|uniref:Uncharacterized protein n=1 Tax=Streptomyces varsoviensis TaxID=67373 RepID=A0ABR5JDP7_9ACTN|nr:hypothetical protein ADK38_02780 [Streptomyces varsoviensis]